MCSNIPAAPAYRVVTIFLMLVVPIRLPLYRRLLLSMFCRTFRSTWVHPQYLLGFVFFILFCLPGVLWLIVLSFYPFSVDYCILSQTFDMHITFLKHKYFSYIFIFFSRGQKKKCFFSMAIDSHMFFWQKNNFARTPCNVRQYTRHTLACNFSF